MLKLTILVLTVALAAVTAFGQAPTLRIVSTDGPDLPADLYYGTVRVKPLRIRPGTNTPITIDDADFFVHQQYVDLLGRFGDQGGLGYWTGQITACGNNALCIYSRRVGVSAAFFIENEFQRTGSFVYRVIKGGVGRRPGYTEFGADRRLVVEGPNLEQTKQAYALAFVQRAEFLTKYNGQNTGDQFVDALIASIQTNSAVSLVGSRSAILTAYNSGADQNSSRALALRAAIEDPLFTGIEYNRSFVTMQYFAYLKREPEEGGYLFWLDVLNNRVPNNYQGMVCAFITSAEYQQRFGSQVTQNDHNCGNILQ
jgi:Domain of unknown function (DUF4214)